MQPEIRSLLLRANRLLGAGLVDHNLVRIQDLERANERLLEIVADDNLAGATVLGILANELKALREEDLLIHLVETEGLGIIDLSVWEIPEDARRLGEPSLCLATWSVPFDKEEDFTSIATAYYLSPAVRTFWEKRCGGRILWFCTTLEAIQAHVERVESVAASASALPGESGANGAGGPKGSSRPPFPAANATPAPAGAPANRSR